MPNHQAARQAEQDLATYFSDYPGCLSPGSNYGAMCAAIGARGEQSNAAAKLSWQVVKPSGSSGMRAREEATEADGRLLGLASREYAVRRVLGAVGPACESVLWAGCVGTGLGLEAFGPRAALAPLSCAALLAWRASSTTKTFGEWLVRLSWRMRTDGSSASAFDRLLARDISAEAAVLWREAMGAYLRALDVWKARDRGRREAAARAARARGEAVGAWDVPEDPEVQRGPAQAA